MPWRRNNPFDPPEPAPKKEIPSTMIRVKCAGCKKVIDIRVRKKDNGFKVISCHNCLRVTEVHVNNLKSIRVVTYRQDGSDRHECAYEKVWQE